MKNHHSRRQVLRGAGGFTLALPFLPSVASRAFAADPVAPNRLRFIAISTQQGGLKVESMYPAKETLTERMTLTEGHDIAWGPLRATDDGTRAVLSPVLRAPKGLLTPRLIGKINVLNGFDVPFYVGHQTGVHLGNYVRSDQGPKHLAAFPTVDQVMAWSPSFYRDLTGVKLRSIVTGGDFNGVSFGYSRPSERAGAIQKMAVEQSPRKLFDRLFAGGAMGATPPAEAPQAARPKPIVDLVMEDYKRLRNGSRRLSTQDKRRLDDHLDRMAELERTLTVTAKPLSCGSVTAPGAVTQGERGVSTARQYFAALNKLIVQALACGTSRIAVAMITNNFSDHGGNWHMDVAHRCTEAGPQKLLTDALAEVFQHVFLDLAAQLDAVDDGGGATALDNTLLQWTQESGILSHDGQGIPVVTAGGAGGFFRTGLYVDYRNLTKGHQINFFGNAGGSNPYAGLLYRQWLATALQAMRVPRSEWERSGKPGYGDPYVADGYSRAVVPRVLQMASEVAPVIGRA